MCNSQNKDQRGRAGSEKGEEANGASLCSSTWKQPSEAAHHLLEDGVVRVVGVAHRIRPSQQHLEWDVGDELTQLLQPAPGALVQEAHGNIKGGTWKSGRGASARALLHSSEILELGSLGASSQT